MFTAVQYTDSKCYVPILVTQFLCRFSLKYQFLKEMYLVITIYLQVMHRCS